MNRIILPLAAAFLFFFNSLFAATTAGRAPKTVVETGKRTYLLSDWRYFYGDSPEYSNAEADETGWGSVDFPVSEMKFDLDKGHVAWFRKTVVIPASASGRSLGLYTGKLSDAAEVYFNGTLVGSSGSMPPRKFFGTSSVPRYFVIPDRLVRPDRDNVLAIRIYNVRVRVNFGRMYLSDVPDVIASYQVDYFLNCTLAIIASILAVFVSSYYFLLFFRERQNRFNMFIALAFLGMALYYSNLYLEASPLSFLLTNKIQFIGLYLGVLLYVFYFQEFYKIHNRAVLRIILSVVTLGCSGILLAAKDYPAFDMLNGKYFYLGLVVPLMLYGMTLSVIAMVKGNRYAKFFFLALLFIFLAGVRDILYVAMGLQPRFWMSAMGMIAYILTIFFTSASWAVDIHRESVEVNKNLERKVADRTRELREAYGNLDVAYRSIQSDLKVAQKIQTQLLPSGVDSLKKMSVHVRFIPMGEVGGDIYDITELSSDRYRFFLADATGHGVQAALVTMIIKNEYERLKAKIEDPAAILRIMNQAFVGTYKSFTLFYTSFIADIDLAANTLTYCSAGHPDQVLLQDGEAITLSKCGKPVGLIEGVDYRSRTVPLSERFRLFLFTDGLTEEFNRQGEEFGPDGFLDAVRYSANESAEKIAEDVMRKLSDFMAGNAVNDDLTLIGIERKA